MDTHIAPFIVTDGRRFRLRAMDTDGSRRVKLSREEAGRALAARVAALAELQEALYADNRWGVLLIFQAMDAAGKDSVIKHVLSGVNPQGCQVASFKAPSSEELDHDFLWRTTLELPERGRIGVFNRSYYEEVLVARVHPELLKAQRLPRELVTPRVWQERFEDIAGFERHMARSGFVIRKFFLHVSKEEQRKRFLKRLDEPGKRWKFSMGDVRERDRWGDYMKAYEEMVRHTSAPHAPWIVVPADRKWLAHYVVATAVVDAIAELDLRLPKLSAAQRRDLAAARKALTKPDTRRR
ncbi:MAG: polyphosphate kinase 2 family protein [Acidobacteriota bacterium]|nr:polyphosphate kinase 2 family protein [Acidobacteriota bacterium]